MRRLKEEEGLGNSDPRVEAAVAELLERPRLHEALIEALGKCPNDADAVTVRLAAPPPKAGTQASPSALAARLNDLLKVKAAVRCAPMLAAAFSADDDSWDIITNWIEGEAQLTNVELGLSIKLKSLFPLAYMADSAVCLSI